MATLQEAIAQIQTYALTLSNVQAAPAYMPDSANIFPFVVSYAKSGDWTSMSSGFKKGLHTIVTEIHIARADLPKALEQAMPYAESFPNKILGNPTLNGKVDTVIAMRYEFGPLKFAAQDTVGWKFSTDIKMQSAIT